MQLFNSNRQRLGLSSTTPLGRGGEAEIYSIAGMPPRVAKVYHTSNRTIERHRKLGVMITNPPVDPQRARGHVSIAWPTEQIFDHAGQFVGFIMPAIDIARSRKLVDIYNVTTYPRGLTWADLLLIARNLAFALAELHRKGYVVGDLNESNILVARNDLITFVDCDSMQVRDPATGQVFRCPVGKGEYSPPELQGLNFGAVDRTPESDNFALAVIVCQLVLLGRHPFSGGQSASIEENIKNRDSFLLNAGAQAPNGTPPISILPSQIRSLLVQCFQDGHTDPKRRPSAEDWGNALDSVKILQTCIQCQIHRYSGHLATCPWCQYKQGHNFDPFTYRWPATPHPQRLPRLQKGGVPNPLPLPLPLPHAQPVRAPRRLQSVALGLVIILALVFVLRFILPPTSGPDSEVVPSTESAASSTSPPVTEHNLENPADLEGFYSGLIESADGERPILISLRITDVARISDVAATFLYTWNTRTHRRDGVGRVQLGTAIVSLAPQETFRAVITPQEVVLRGQSGTLRRSR